MYGPNVLNPFVKEYVNGPVPVKLNVSVVLAPTQISASPLTEAVGNAYTVKLAEADLEHPDSGLVAVTV